MIKKRNIKVVKDKKSNKESKRREKIKETEEKISPASCHDDLG